MRPDNMRQVAKDMRRAMDQGEHPVVILNVSPDLGEEEILAILHIVNAIKGVTTKLVAIDEGPIE